MSTSSVYLRQIAASLKKHAAHLSRSAQGLLALAQQIERTAGLVSRAELRPPAPRIPEYTELGEVVPPIATGDLPKLLETAAQALKQVAEGERQRSQISTVFEDVEGVGG